MNNLIYVFKELYAYCTDFVINLANITGLSYYEINFMIFVVLYPLFLIAAPTFYFIQKSRLRNYKKMQPSLNTETESNFLNIKTFSKRKILISANLAWLFLIGLGTQRIFTDSTNEYNSYQSKGNLSPNSDSITMPILRETFLTFLILAALLVLLNVFLSFTTYKANLPTKLFVIASKYSIPSVLWEVFFSFGLLLNILFLIHWIWVAYFTEALFSLFFVYILFSLRAGKISKY